MSELHHLPEAVLKLVTMFLDAENMCVLACVNKKLNFVATSLANYLLSKFTKQYFNNDTEILEDFEVNSSSTPQESHANLVVNPFRQLHNLTKPRVLLLRGYIAYTYNISTGNWKRCRDLRRDRGYFNALWHQGEIYAICTYSIIAAGTVEKYNPLSNRWTVVGSLPQKIRCGAAVSYQNSIYLFGGIEAFSNEVINSIHVYRGSSSNNSTNLSSPFKNLNISSEESTAWENLSPTALRFTRSNHAATCVDGIVYIAGGRFGPDNPSHPNLTNAVESFNPISCEFIDIVPMLRSREFFHLVCIEKRLYAVGGDVDDDTPSIEVLDEGQSSWEIVTHFKSKRHGFSCCSFQSKIYIFGGDGNSEVSTIDAFDVSLGSWRSETSSLQFCPFDNSWGQAVLFPPEGLIEWDI